MSRSSARFALVSLSLLFAVAGCGYQLVRQGGAGQRTVSIVTLRNDSVEPGIELTVTRALRQEFLRRSAPRLVADPAAADFVIRGRVLPLETSANSYDTVALALEYRVELALELTISTPDGDGIELDRASLVESELYLASADPEATRKNRVEALRRVSDVLASRVRDAVGLRLVEGGALPRSVTAGDGAS